MLSVSRISPIVRQNGSVDQLGLDTLKALEKLPQWQTQPAAFSTLVRPFFENLTANLPVSADSKVDVTGVLKIAKAYLTWMQSNKVLEKTRDTLPAGDLTRMAIELQITLIAQLVPQIDAVLKDVPGTLERQGLSERQALAQQFKPEMMALYDAGKLSVATACRLQPDALFYYGKRDGQAKMQSARV
jgi:hypothetical protein